jgi:hypothetical protein
VELASGAKVKQRNHGGGGLYHTCHHDSVEKTFPTASGMHVDGSLRRITTQIAHEMNRVFTPCGNTVVDSLSVNFSRAWISASS